MSGRKPPLGELNLSENGIGSSGMVALVKAFAALPCLAKLNISDNEVGDAGVAAFATAVRERSFPAAFSKVSLLRQAASTEASTWGVVGRVGWA